MTRTWTYDIPVLATIRELLTKRHVMRLIFNCNKILENQFPVPNSEKTSVTIRNVSKETREKCLVVDIKNI